MDPEKWGRIKELFGLALEREPDQRAGFLEEACRGDPTLRSEVESLLASYHASRPSAGRANPSSYPTVTTATEAADIMAGQRIGAYQVTREIGHGGMAIVYLAVRADDQYRKRVAIKVVGPGLSGEEILQRFRNERQTLAALDHSNIVKLLDGGSTEEGQPYLVMEYVEGMRIDEYCDGRRLTITERLQLFRIVCGAVQYAHQNLVIHRDLKPANILVTSDGIPKLLDFGIAKLLNPEFSAQPLLVTQAGERLMTPEYASPEQIRGLPLTTATDVYSLGVVLYQLLSGHRPYRLKNQTPLEIERAICEEEPEKPSTAVTRRAEPHAPTGRPLTPESVSRTREGAPDRLQRRLTGDLDTIVLMALRKEPQRRYASVEQLAEDLRRHLENQPVLARHPTWRYRTGKFTRRHRAAVIATVLTVLALIGGIIGTTWQARVARAEKARAERRFNDVRKLANSFLFEFHDSIQNLPGATPARKLIVGKALEYLGSLSQEAGGEAALRMELADAYLKVGDVQGYPYSPNLGDIDGALDSYRKALAIAEAVARTDAKNAAALRQLARSHERVAVALLQRGDPTGAVNGFHRALEIYEPLSGSDRRNVPLRQDLARCYDSLGDALGNPTFVGQGDTAAALDSYRKALAIDEEIAAGDPSNSRARRGVAVESVHIADMFAERFDTARALESYRNALAMFEALAAKDPTNADSRRSVSVVYHRMADNLAAAGDTAEASASAHQGLAIDEALAAADPANTLAQFDVAVGLRQIGDLEAKRGDVGKALESYRRLLPIMERLAADPSNVQRRSQLAETLIGIGRLQAEVGQLQQARQSSARGLSILKAGVARSDVEPAELLTYASALLTCEPVDLRDPESALRHAEHAATATQGKNAGILDILALAYFQTGDPERAVATEKEALALLPSALAGPPSATRREYETNLTKYAAAMKRVRTSRPAR